MTERFEQVERLYHAALQREENQWGTFLEESCAGDEALRQEVESLLAYSKRSKSFIESPALNAVARAIAREDSQAGMSDVDHYQPGSTISHYEVISHLGSGGMGIIYKARDIRLGRIVALKFLPAHFAQDNYALSRFNREARTASALNHPNICTIHEVGEHEGRPFMVMEYLNGQTLKDFISDRPLATDKLLQLAVEIAEGLEAAHAEGIIHRDIKPSNIFVTQRGRAKVLDFGVAKLQAEDSFRPESSADEASDKRGAPTAALLNSDPNLTTPGSTVGTASYMSPEQARGQQIDARSDLFSFGVVLYEMATGEQAFSGKTTGQVLRSLLEEQPKPVRQLNPALPVAFERIVGKALEKDRNARYQSSTEILTDLKAVDESQRNLGRHKRERLRLLGVVAAVAVVLVSAGIYFYRQGRPSHALTDKDTVLLADFTNNTGEGVWDETLKQGLRVELEQSPYLSIISDENVAQLLRYAGHSANERLTPELARNLCRRAGSRAMLLGSISSVGSHYVIGLQAVNCQNNDSLGEEQAEAGNREGVLTKLHDAGVRMRNKLGESLASIQKYDVPLEQATTSSLDALQAYSTALRAKLSRGDDAALPLLQRAVSLDSNFAMAYAVMGTVYSNLGDSVYAVEYTRKAYLLRDRVTERERFYIDSSYYNMVSGELGKEIEVYELWKQAYPRDRIPYQRLAYCDGYLGQYDKAVVGYREVLKLEPNDVVSYVDLASTYLTLGRLDDAKAVLDGLKARNLEHEYVPELYYLLAFLRGDPKEMETMVSAAGSSPNSSDILLSSQADTEAYYGRLQSARDYSRKAVESALHYQAKGRAAEWQAHAALREAELGNVVQAREQAAAALAMGEDVQEVAAMALARIGDVAKAQTIAEELARRSPTDLWLNNYWLPSIKAAIKINQKEPADAIEALEVTRPYETGGDPITLDTLYPVYLRGQAYLMIHNGNAAVAEFQRILEDHGRVANGILGALVHLQLGRSYASVSDKGKARMAYEDFLTLWKNGDSGAHLRRQATAENSALH